MTVTRSTPGNGSSDPLFPVVADADLPLIEAGQFARASPCLADARGPFLWQGDTAWAASMRARLDLQASVASPCTTAHWAANDWKCYVDDRAAKGFSVVQLAVPQYWMGEPFVDAAGRAPFVDSADFPGWSQWDPDFWKAFEEKVRYADERGLVVLVVGIMEPSYRHLDDPVPNALRYPDLPQARTFARNLAALLAGDEVILSPGFDTPPSDPDRAGLIRRIGQELKASVPGILVTNHFGGRTPTQAAGGHNDYLDFCHEPWLDFVLLQSGQARALRAGDPHGQLQAITKQARQLPVDLRSSGCEKPLINAEAVYDFEGAALRKGKRPPDWWSNYSQYRVRQTGYLTRLSGAAGYSLGVFGLADWGLGDASFDPRPPRAASAATSADDVRRMGMLLRSMRWEWLVPIALEDDSAESRDHLRVVIARDVGRRTTVVYMPDNSEVRLHLNAELYPDFLTSRWTKRFFDPRTGRRQYAAVPKPVTGANDTYEFARPEACANGQTGDCDWVLDLSETSSGPDGELEVWPQWEQSANTWQIKGRVVRSNVTRPDVAISDSTPAMQRLPVTARSPSGAYFVVWDVASTDALGGEVFGRLVDAEGLPQGASFRIGDAASGMQLEPAIAVDSSGQFWVTWTSFSSTNETLSIRMQRFSSSGERLGSEVVVSGHEPGVSRRSPRVAGDPQGRVVVAWQEYTPARSEWTIVARELDGHGAPIGPAKVIEKSGDDYLALETLEVGSHGYEVTWQRLLGGQSQGHYRSEVDRRTGAPSHPALVASQTE